MKRNKPHFRSLSKALDYIQNTLPLLKERRLWQAMQQECIDDGGSWDAD